MTNAITADRCPINSNPGVAEHTGVVDSYFGTPGRWSYFKDRETGHLWMNPAPSEADIPGFYGRYYTHDPGSGGAPTAMQRAHELVLHRKLGYPLRSPPGLKARLLAALPTIAPAAVMDVFDLPAGKTGRLLDFGCGDGQFMSRMAEAGWNVSGIEPDPKAVQALRARKGFDVRASLADFGEGAEAFDVVTMSHVIEHVTDPIGTLRSLRRILRPGGLLLITTPNAASLGSRVFGKYWRGLEPPRHLNVFTPRSLQRALAEAGFTSSTLTTPTRMARRLFWMSQLARQGVQEIELHERSERLVKVAGYGFQLAEGFLTGLGLDVGEEIFSCSET
jgi:2-polyprenyl-3-methyl-5-hydroxy-6-metoxy-1,4-benzoquinol methylase